MIVKIYYSKNELITKMNCDLITIKVGNTLETLCKNCNSNPREIITATLNLNAIQMPIESYIPKKLITKDLFQKNFTEWCSDCFNNSRINTRSSVNKNSDFYSLIQSSQVINQKKVEKIQSDSEDEKKDNNKQFIASKDLKIHAKIGQYKKLCNDCNDSCICMLIVEFGPRKKEYRRLCYTCIAKRFNQNKCIYHEKGVYCQKSTVKNTFCSDHFKSMISNN